MEWYYILGMISYGIFIVQFVLSFVGADSDIDIDLDGDTDFSFNDLVSFKGLIHFLMGLSGWLMITQEVTVLNVILACIVGIGFMVILFYFYKLLFSKLQSIPTRKEGKELIGTPVTIYLTMDSISSEHCICTVCNGGITEEINCKAETPITIGDVRIINDYQNGIYYIS